MPEDKLNIELIKKITTVKEATLSSLRNKTWKKVHEGTGKAHKLFTNITAGNITKLNKLTYIEAKLVCYKNNVPLRNENRNTNQRWKISLEGQVKELVKAKILRDMLS